MSRIYDNTDISELQCRYIDKGGNVATVEDGCLGYGTMIFYPGENPNLYYFVIKEVYLNEWCSGHTVRRYRRLPKKYDKMLQAI